MSGSLIAAPFILFFWLSAMAVSVALFVFWIWMLVEAATKEPSQGNDKVVWILVIVLLHFVGALVYFFARRPERMRLQGK